MLATLAAYNVVAGLRVTLRSAHVARIKRHVDIAIRALHSKKLDCRSVRCIGVVRERVGYVIQRDLKLVLSGRKMARLLGALSCVFAAAGQAPRAREHNEPPCYNENCYSCDCNNEFYARLFLSLSSLFVMIASS